MLFRSGPLLKSGGIHNESSLEKEQFSDDSYNKLISECRDILAREREIKKLESIIGDCYYKLEEYGKALLAYENYLKNYPDDEYADFIRKKIHNCRILSKPR